MMIRIASLASVHFALLCLLATEASAEEVRFQICWTRGTYDQTMYFAEAEAHFDRQQSFTDLLDLSGIDHGPVACRISDPAEHSSLRARLAKHWTASALSIINTTFLSELDY
jgi:hypothetical protein